MTLEGGMAPDMRSDEKISRWPAVRVRLALARQPNDHAVVDSRRNFYLQRVRKKSIAGPLTGHTGKFDDLPPSLTAFTRGQRHKPYVFSGLHILLLPASAAFWTG